jgi:hypothetical protein
MGAGDGGEVPVRIDDLIDPQLSDAQRAALDWAASHPASLDEQDLVDEAQRITGLDDFGSDDVWPRVRAHLDAIEKDVGLNELSRHTQRSRVIGLLVARLRLNDLLRRYPEIRDIEIDRPLIVVGLPRSGTTHLVNLLAADTRFRSLPFWEIEEPFPRHGDGPGRNGIDPRWQRCADAYEMGLPLLPLAPLMHERSPSSIEEEVELLDIDFGSYALEWHARVPGWRDTYLSFDATARYAYLRTILQALTFLRGPRQWVLKSPQHLEQLPALAATFPGATIAVTHRDPVAVIQSAVTMLAYADRIRRHTIEPEALAAYWVDRVERLLRACVRDRASFPPDRSIDVVFHEFMADDVAMVERIYGRAGIEMTATARAQLDQYMVEHPRGKHGQVSYDLRGQFGLDPSDVRERFAFYFDRFPVRAEV